MDFNKRENNHAYKLNLGNMTSRSIHSSQSNKRTNWVGDKAFEETSIQYLQNTNIFKDMNIQEIVKDRDRQLRGIDVIAQLYGQDIKVDIKSIASQLPTFCFEISGNINTSQKGWLINPDVETEYYLIVYHEIIGASSYRQGKALMTQDNVAETEAMLINKETLKKEIERHLGDLEVLVDKIRAYEIHQKSAARFNEKGELVKNRNRMNIYPVLSCGLYEQPINIVVRKEVLKELAIMHWIIHDKG